MANEVAYSKMLTIGDNPIFGNNTARQRQDTRVDTVDSDWLKSVFMIGDSEIDDADGHNRYFVSSDIKFTDTKLGGNIAINNYPQFTPYADIRSKGRLAGRQDVTVHSKGNLGMGHFYSETFDDNAFNVFMQFGVPEFNSLLSFFTRGINRNDLVVAKTGRRPTAHRIGEVVGTVAAFLVMPVITVSILVTKEIVDLVVDDKPFNYYYMKPTMHTYWSSVNTIVNTIAAELGIIIPEFLPEKRDADRMALPLKMIKEDIEVLASLAPGIVGDDGFIDVFAIANRAQILANRQIKLEYEAYKKSSDNDDTKGFIDKVYSFITSDGGNNKATFSKFVNDLLTTSSALDYQDPKVYKEPTNPSTSTESDADYEPDDHGNYKTTSGDSFLSTFRKTFDSTVRGGGAYAVFRVDYPGEPSESLTNNVGDIESNGILKSVAKGAKDKRFMFAGGNIVGDAVQSAFASTMEVVSGALSGVTFGLSDVVTGILGGAYVDIPKAWDDSTFSLPTQTFSIQLISNSAHPLAQLQNIYIPLAMILAGALPQSAGRASYTSPFLCSMFMKGIQEIELGMITSLSIRRGTSNLGFNKQKRALAIEVSFTVTDLSNLMTAAINHGMFSDINAIIDDSAPLGRYIKTLASRDILTDKYFLPRAKIRITKKLYELNKVLSPSAIGMRAGSLAEAFLGGLVHDYSLNLTERN